jgi:hypothetical protein
LGGFAALFLILSGDYNPTAALFPRWVALASVIFMLAVAGVRLFGKPRARAEPSSDEDFPESAVGAVPWPAVLALQAAYLVGIYFLGFTLATLLYLAIAPIQMYYRRWALIGIHAVLLTIIISGSFIWFFHIRLPSGLLWSSW